ncbi:hypothetical protein SAMN02745704_02584 [Paucidesulfovibrio gracilis DSM 16080]|uniref:TIGR01777 family protein n=1 Tax=Paucidesulfovibrio gracilis DSM 16080 TaxID=1121449 RepID=A0A1T4XY06_9BACT|nr:TIGR01777 family oxidoreductase [Paucidesulfovibrio gracilis]SKA94437.1 hypothetical protein SAMN02745704_02584 [Paucidesulfovibrio gracilis DSM 16080]
MRVIILGGTGFIGQALCVELMQGGHEVAVLSRSQAKVRRVFGEAVQALEWGGEDSSWADALGPDTAVVNLAGQNIAARWTPNTMQRIRDSRVRSGEAVVRAVQAAKQHPAIVVQGSAIGFYGSQPGEKELDESSPSGDGFLAQVCRDWEASSQEIETMGVPRAVIRTGVVLGPGGALERMITPFRLFAGGPVGNGKHVLSWIQLADEVGAIRYLIEHRLGGIYNLTAPSPATSREFAKTLGSVLHRPALLPTPGPVLRLLFGKMADEVLLAGQRVLPRALLQAGYQFRFPTLQAALSDAVQKLSGQR